MNVEVKFAAYVYHLSSLVLQATSRPGFAGFDAVAAAANVAANLKRADGGDGGDEGCGDGGSGSGGNDMDFEMSLGARAAPSEEQRKAFADKVEKIAVRALLTPHRTYCFRLVAVDGGGSGSTAIGLASPPVEVGAAAAIDFGVGVVDAVNVESVDRSMAMLEAPGLVDFTPPKVFCVPQVSGRFVPYSIVNILSHSHVSYCIVNILSHSRVSCSIVNIRSHSRVLYCIVNIRSHSRVLYCIVNIFSHSHVSYRIVNIFSHSHVSYRFVYTPFYTAKGVLRAAGQWGNHF
jgi:hypothetical protein